MRSAQEFCRASVVAEKISCAMRRDLFAQVFFARRNFMRNAQRFFAQVFLRKKCHAQCAGILCASAVAIKFMRDAQRFFAQV